MPRGGPLEGFSSHHELKRRKRGQAADSEPAMAGEPQQRGAGAPGQAEPWPLTWLSASAVDLKGALLVMRSSGGPPSIRTAAWTRLLWLLASQATPNGECVVKAGFLRF